MLGVVCECHWTTTVVSTIVGLFVLSWLVNQLRALRRVSPTDRDGTKKAVVVSGCDTGFGNLLAKELGKRGFEVFAGCLTLDGLKKLQSETSDNVHAHLLDVTKDDSVKKFFEFVDKNTKRGLWGVVNNAGVMDGHQVDFTPMRRFSLCMEVNYLGLVRMTKAALPLLKKRRGRIVNVASVAGRFGPVGMGGYAASKHAVEGFTDTLRREMLPLGIRVSTIEPGLFRTAIVRGTAPGVKRVFDEIDSAQKAEYGQEYFDKHLQDVSKFNHMGGDPTLVVDGMCHALTAGLPKIRYIIGIDCFVVVRILCEIFPTRLTDFILGLGNVPVTPKFAQDPAYWTNYD